MGCYVNPYNEEKEDFLGREGEEVVSDYISENFDYIKSKGKLPVVLVKNDHFSAAGVAYCISEFERFIRYDNRPKKFYLVDIEKLKEICNVEDYLKEVQEQEWRKRY